MKTRSKVFLATVCAVLLVVASVFGTLAYLTDNDEVTNTFTVGSVELKLDEAPVDETGKETDGARVQKNDYHLLPGMDYDKDPTVTVLEGSDPCYVRMRVTISFKAEKTLEKITDLGLDLDSFFTGYEAKQWNRSATYPAADGKSVSYVYRYLGGAEIAQADGGIVDATDGDKELTPLFTGIRVPGTLTHDQIALLDGMEIEVQADAIQAASFESYTAAWTAFNDQEG